MPLTNSVWSYSLNRQQRPLATHTGPAAATSRSTSAYIWRTASRNTASMSAQILQPPRAVAELVRLGPHAVEHAQPQVGDRRLLRVLHVPAALDRAAALTEQERRQV